MNTKLILASLAAAAAQTMPAAVQIPTYTAIDYTQYVSNGLFHGNTTLVDLNNDGNLELIAKGRDLNNGWATTMGYLSGDGYGYNAWTALSDPDGCSWERIYVPIDYNADGNVDLIFASSWNAKLLKGDGTGNFEPVDNFSLDGEISIDGDDSEKWYTGLMAVADFNLDGYPDIVTFCGNPREDKGEPVLFLNNGGDGSFTKQYGVGLIAQRGGTIAAGDFNRDGAPDLAVSGWNDDFGNDCIRLYKNNGDATFTEVASDEFNAALAGTEKGHIIFADIDGDGWLDLFVTGESCPQSWAKLACVYKNENGTSFSKMSVSLPGVKASGADWCDLNGDGNIDIVYAGEADNGCVTVAVINEGNGTLTPRSDLMSGHRGGATVQVADFNNNYMPDVMVMGYNDNGPHFEVYNGLCSRGMNTNPSAPTDLSATADGSKTVFTWAPGSDSETAEATLRYNLFAKLKNGKTISVIPADTETGRLRMADVNATLTSTSYTLNVSIDEIAQWGVQTIDGAKAASTFTTTTTSGITSVTTNGNGSLEATYSDGMLTVNADAALTVTNMAGASVAAMNAKAGCPVGMTLLPGVYIVKATSGEAISTLKILVK